MNSFEVLCVTMGQHDFSKIQEMNLHSNVVFANQSDFTGFDEIKYDTYSAKMISTETRGVGVNRNIALMYASADICLFADDDVKYDDNLQNIILHEFNTFPDADIIIFHLQSNCESRKQIKYNKSRKSRIFEKSPWGAVRIAFKLESVRKSNIWFSTLFGGGCLFPSGEDSMWINDAKKAHLKFYISKSTIGTVSFENSSWFSGYNEKFYFSKGAYYGAVNKTTFIIRMLYFLFRTRKYGNMSLSDKIKWMNLGKLAYKDMQSFESVSSLIK